MIKSVPLRRFSVKANSLRRPALTRVNRIGLPRYQPFSTVNLNTNEFAKSEGESCDIVICGGSIVGASLAASLLRRSNGSLKICVIDSAKSRSELSVCLSKAIPDSRTYALSPKSMKFLESIGAWETIHQRAHPYESMQIWESMSEGLVRFHAAEMGIARLGCIAEDSTILASIYESIASHSSANNIELRFDSRIKDIIVNKVDENVYREAEVVYEHGGEVSKISSRLVIGADGGNSSVRRLANISTYGWSYGQEAIVGTLKVENDPGNGFTAYQRYLPSGPLALLPLWNGYYSLVWSLPVSEAKRLQALSNDKFLKILNDVLQSPTKSAISFETSDEPSGPLSQIKSRFQSMLETVVSAGLIIDPYRCPPIIKELSSQSLLSFPLSFQHAKTYIAPRIALIGDAAHSIHPQAGQGLNLGLADVQSLSNTIMNGLLTGQDIGKEFTLRSYNDERYAANLAMMATVDTINTIFAENKKHLIPSDDDADSTFYKAKRSLRSIGMIGVHTIPQIKQKIAKFATGLDV